MPRNRLKSFPTALLRRGLAHVHPSGPGSGRPFTILNDEATDGASPRPDDAADHPL